MTQNKQVQVSSLYESGNYVLTLNKTTFSEQIVSMSNLSFPE
jgi:hypothetical protein